MFASQLHSYEPPSDAKEPFARFAWPTSIRVPSAWLWTGCIVSDEEVQTAISNDKDFKPTRRGSFRPLKKHIDVRILKVSNTLLSPTPANHSGMHCIDSVHHDDKGTGKHLRNDWTQSDRRPHVAPGLNPASRWTLPHTSKPRLSSGRKHSLAVVRQGGFCEIDNESRVAGVLMMV